MMSAGCAAQSPSNSSTANLYSRTLQVGNQKLFVQIVTTPADMAQGLSNRASMRDDQGMLFDFGQSTRSGFWMKDMKFNLDFVWINNEKIIGITPNVPAPQSPNDRLPVYYPPSTVDEVLEANAGWSEKNKIKIGDEIRVVD